MRYLRIIATLILLAAFIQGCGGSSDKDKAKSENSKLKIVTTTGMIADAARNVGGEFVEVRALMGPGVDPHLYKASAGDVRRMSEADLLLYHGLHLEAAMTEVFEKMARTTSSFPVTKDIEEKELYSPPHYSGMHDPHVWFDVSIWMTVVKTVKDILIEVNPEHAEAYKINYASYRVQLEELHQYIMTEAHKVPEAKRVLITAHDAFNYFGKAYGYKVMGLQGISTASEAGTADVRDLAEFIAANKIPAIFVESSVPRRSIEAVQAAVESRGFNVKIGGQLFSDAMGSAGTPEESYVGMVRYNINTIVKALMQ